MIKIYKSQLKKHETQLQVHIEELNKEQNNITNISINLYIIGGARVNYVVTN